MNKKNKSILLALAIGDGCISKKNDNRCNYTQYSITFKHSIKQYEYLQYKANIVNSIFGGKQNEVRYINNNGYDGCIYSKSNSDLKYIYNILYPKGKKQLTEKVLNNLTPEGIAIWYMDDGSLYPQKQNGKIKAFQMVISTCCDTKEETQIIIDYFVKKWGVKFHIKRNKGKYSITCNTKEIRKFIPIVSPYVKKIECMKYKIDRIKEKD